MSILDVIGKDHNAGHTARFSTWTLQTRRFVICEVFLLLSNVDFLCISLEGQNWGSARSKMLIGYLVGRDCVYDSTVFTWRGIGSWLTVTLDWRAKNACLQLLQAATTNGTPRCREGGTGIVVEAPNLVVLYLLEFSPLGRQQNQ